MGSAEGERSRDAGHRKVRGKNKWQHRIIFFLPFSFLSFVLFPGGGGAGGGGGVWDVNLDS